MLCLVSVTLWTLNTSSKKKLEAAEMWFYRRMMRISWVKKWSNEKVLQIEEIERRLTVTVRKRQLSFVGHIVRRDSLERLVLEEKIKGKRQRGRQRMKFLEDLALTVGCSVVELLRCTGDRIGFRKVVANVRF